mgnify:CR=1 FL=1
MMKKDNSDIWRKKTTPNRNKYSTNGNTGNGNLGSDYSIHDTSPNNAIRNLGGNNRTPTGTNKLRQILNITPNKESSDVSNRKKVINQKNVSNYGGK